MPTKSPSHSAELRQTAAGQAWKQQQRDAEAQAVYKSRRWARVRARVLSEAPWCADPFQWHAAVGEVRRAVEVDHIVPLRVARGLAYARGNLQGLCRRCHARKTAGQREGNRKAAEGSEVG